ncbi:MAG: glycosyltransferase family 39 protein [Leptolyngbya sp. SIO1D8]|nr:glycosyltransferase family 39 protein [Leptolyngbya sp. SIO1D8]
MISQKTTKASDRRIIFFLLLAALLLFCIDLNGIPLRDWDEGTVAQVAREMSQGDTWTAWLHPQLWGQPYLNKPPLMHSLIALAYRTWGIHTWTARLPGAVLTAISVPWLYALGREVFFTRAPALVSALVYLTLLPVVRHGRLAMLDGAIVCFFIATLWMLRRATSSQVSAKGVRPYWCFGVGVGFALMCLTKGILGVLLLAIALVFLAWDSPKHLFSPHLWLGLLLGGIPLTVWYLLQWQYYGQQFINTAVMTQSLERIWNTVERHDGPPWYYLLELLKYSWPWLIFWPTGFWLTWRSRHHTWAKLVLVWTIGYLLAISIMGTKLPWYIFPLYPAVAFTCGVALAAALNMHRHWTGRGLSLRKLPKIWGILLALFSAVGAIGIVYASPWGGEPSVALGLTFLAVMLTTGLASFLVLHQQLQFVPTLLVGLYLALMCLMVSDHWVWELGEDFPVLPVAELIRQNTPPSQIIYTSHGYERPSLSFYSDRRVTARSIEELQSQWQNTQPAYLLVQDIAPYQNIKDHLTELGIVNGWHLILNQPQG